MTFFLISQCRFSDLPKSTAVFILSKKMKKINFSKSIFFSYLSAGFQICDVVWVMNEFCSQKIVLSAPPDIVLGKNFFKSTAVFYTCKKNQFSETAVLFTLYGCFLHLVKKIIFFKTAVQNSRTFHSVSTYGCFNT